MSIASLCELFVRFVTRTALTQASVETDFETLKRLLIERGETLALTALEARSKIARAGAPFVEAGATVLTVGYSRVVLALREHAPQPHLGLACAKEGFMRMNGGCSSPRRRGRSGSGSSYRSPRREARSPAEAIEAPRAAPGPRPARPCRP